MPTQQPDHIDAADVPVNPAVGRLVFGWLLVGVPLAYGVITTLSRVGQLFQ
ncbi:hypothetical protein OIU93_04870 [Paeniglutamicibacter sp. ZC-3]|uniref:MFS transporter small subunit n=1 Tax=Paeniglutamicibacter TaxID=1742990 RepID=UPI0021F78F4E|nr:MULTISPECIES: hypothetical protein [Paeniglutamicibacter]MCV9993631.1 hypothetical protein [Paeniglutamicibacter sp. ZC-3]MDO2936333.1 hypothetical protein [Paeniglutamicibacter sulfureus]